MRILKHNEIPDKDSKIYPEINTQFGRVRKYQDWNVLEYVAKLSTLVKITRDNIDYLIPVNKYWTKMVKIDEEVDLSKVVSWFNKDCENIIEYYVVNDDLVNDYGLPILIYKYEA